jgi:hypothetical protein
MVKFRYSINPLFKYCTTAISAILLHQVEHFKMAAKNRSLNVKECYGLSCYISIYQHDRHYIKN